MSRSSKAIAKIVEPPSSSGTASPTSTPTPHPPHFTTPSPCLNQRRPIQRKPHSTQHPQCQAQLSTQTFLRHHHQNPAATKQAGAGPPRTRPQSHHLSRHNQATPQTLDMPSSPTLKYNFPHHPLPKKAGYQILSKTNRKPAPHPNINTTTS